MGTGREISSTNVSKLVMDFLIEKMLTAPPRLGHVMHAFEMFINDNTSPNSQLMRFWEKIKGNIGIIHSVSDELLHDDPEVMELAAQVAVRAIEKIYRSVGGSFDEKLRPLQDVNTWQPFIFHIHQEGVKYPHMGTGLDKWGKVILNNLA